MSDADSAKKRLRHLSETSTLLGPIRKFLQFLATGRYRFAGFLHRFWISIRLLKIRIRHGKKLNIVYRGIGIGDIVCTFPLVAELRKQYPDHVTVYVTNRQSRVFVEKFSTADVVISTTYSLFSRPLPQLPKWMATKAQYPRYKGEYHGDFAGTRTGYVMEMASSFGISLSQPRPTITVDKNSADSSLRHLGAQDSSRPLIGIHLGPSSPVREYPFASWQELAQRLRSELGATIFQFGSKYHQATEQARAMGKLEVQFDLTDRLELVETTELLSTMDLFIGIDSGLLHIANAVHIPAIGLFGPTDPAVVLSQTTGVGLFSKDMPCIFCQHRHLNLHWNTGCPFDIQCMKLISVNSVIAQAKSILAASGLISIRAS